MKKSHLPLVIILTVLITVIVIASIALVIVLSAEAPSGQHNDSTTPPEAITTTTQKPTDSTTTTQQPNDPKPPVTTPEQPDTPKPPVTTPKPPVTTPEQPDTPKPPVTNPPPAQTTTKPNSPTPTPGLSAVSGKVEGDHIDSLGVFAEYVTEEIDQDANTMKIRFTFYLQSYGLRIGARNDNYLVVNGETIPKLSTDKINLPNGSPLTRTELYEYVVEIEKQEDTPVELELEYFWHFQGTYAGEKADWMSVKVFLTL